MLPRNPRLFSIGFLNPSHIFSIFHRHQLQYHGENSCNFVVNLAKAGNTFKEIKGIMDDAFSNTFLWQTQIYCFMDMVKANHRRLVSARLVHTSSWMLTDSFVWPKGTRPMLHTLWTSWGIFSKCSAPSAPHLASSERWFLHLNNALVHTARLSKDFMVQNQILAVVHPPYSPDPVPSNIFFFPGVKAALAGIKVDGNSMRQDWERVMVKVIADKYANTYRRWIN